jgi:transcriptional regulator with XRE-family HTH domain
MFDSQKFRRLRIGQGMTQESLAKLSGITKVTISELENRRRDNVTLDTLAKLARPLGVKPKELLK